MTKEEISYKKVVKTEISHATGLNELHVIEENFDLEKYEEEARNNEISLFVAWLCNNDLCPSKTPEELMLRYQQDTKGYAQKETEKLKFEKTLTNKVDKALCWAWYSNLICSVLNTGRKKEIRITEAAYGQDSTLTLTGTN